MRKVDSKNRLELKTVKLLILNKKFKKYDVLNVPEEQVSVTIEKIKTEGLQYEHVANEGEINKKMKTIGYSRTKYY